MGKKKKDTSSGDFGIVLTPPLLYQKFAFSSTLTGIAICKGAPLTQFLAAYYFLQQADGLIGLTSLAQLRLPMYETLWGHNPLAADV